MNKMNEHGIVGKVTLRFGLPTSIGEPYSMAVDGAGMSVGLTQAQCDHLAGSIHAQAYFKCCKQLFSSLTAPQKCEAQELEAVYYDESPVPSNMANAVGFIGHFETIGPVKRGRFEVKHPVVLFRRWLVEGLRLSPGVGDQFNPPSGMSNSQALWRDKPSLEYAKDAALRRLKEVTEEEFELEIQGEQHQFRPPFFDPQDEDVTLESVQAQTLLPQRDTIRALIALSRMSLAQFRDPEMAFGLDHPTWDDMLGAIGCFFSQPSAAQTRDAFEDASKDYLQCALPHIKAFFHVRPGIASGRGYGAQIASSNGREVRFSLPLSQGDIYAGFLYNPMSDIELEPSFVASFALCPAEF